MDELLCDPHLAPQFVQLLNKNLQETRKALEALQKVRMLGLCPSKLPEPAQ